MTQNTDNLYKNIPDDELFCDVCGMTYKEFLETGVFGCENCYRVFKARTIELIKKQMSTTQKPQIIKNAVKNIKTSKTKKEKSKKDEEKIMELEDLLNLCIKYNEIDKAEVIKKEIERLKDIDKEESEEKEK